MYSIAMALHPVLLEKLNMALGKARSIQYIQRDARLSEVPGKVHAVTGMRRSGKTTFLRQLLDEQRERVPSERVLYISFDDERLTGIESDQLSHLLEEYYRRYPESRGEETVSWYLDEIQMVPGWDRFIRRVLDTEQVEIVVSGSSARMLSREVHTSLRGRGMETVIHPFSFREFLRYRGEEPSEEPRKWTSSDRSFIEKRFREYILEGGFPETQKLKKAFQIELLQGYVNTVLFRDVIERYEITQVAALKWLVRHCLRNPAGSFSVNKLYNDIKAQGLAVSKDSVHKMFGYLIDSFLISTISLATESERKRNTNPRKIYPADPGLIRAFDSSGRENTGRALETTVFNEIERRKGDVGYVKTKDGFEVDFKVRYPGGPTELIQVCAEMDSEATAEREFRALQYADEESPEKTRTIILVMNREQADTYTGSEVEVKPAYEWLLEEYPQE